jgi:hypothetical protein
MKIAFFLTGHGFGHGVRNSALISALPNEVEVDIYTSLPESFFREELNRPYRLIPCEIDCGCLQTDTVEVAVEATLQRYAELNANRDAIIREFAIKLKASLVDLVIGDIPPLAFPIARAAGIPAWSFCNFEWTDIYRPFLSQFPSYGPMLQTMMEDYKLADRHIRFFPFMPASKGMKFEEIGLVCRPGVSRREEFAQKFGLDIKKKWCLIYIGSFGLDGVAWNKLAQFKNCEFLGLYPLKEASANYHHIQKDLSYRYADLTASVDLVIGKLGYGLVAECLSLAKPILFLGRNGFSEYTMLRQLLLNRRMGLEISLERFRALEIAEALNALLVRELVPMPATGIAQIMEKMGFIT